MYLIYSLPTLSLFIYVPHTSTPKSCCWCEPRARHCFTLCTLETPNDMAVVLLLYPYVALLQLLTFGCVRVIRYSFFIVFFYLESATVPQCTLPADLGSQYNISGCAEMMFASACELSCAGGYSGSPNVECSTDGGNFTINGSCEGS